MADTRKCRFEIRKQLLYGSTEIFTAYDHCVALGSCKFIRLKEQLENKIYELKRLIKTEEEGFGSLNRKYYTNIFPFLLNNEERNEGIINRSVLD